MTPYLSLIVCIIGLIIYMITNPVNNKAVEVGRIMFAFGLLALLLTAQSLNLPTIHLGR